MKEITACHFVISGRVQGVFFRDWTVKTARQLELSGWVRNLADGTVEIHAEGPSESMEHFASLLHEGPRAADVTGVKRKSVPIEPVNGFLKRADA